MSQEATVRRPAEGNNLTEVRSGTPATEVRGCAPATDVRSSTPEADAGNGSPEPCSGEFCVGDVIKERYELVQILGRGAMGTVFLAKDLLEEQYEERDPYFAIKFLGSEFASHPQARIALEREARKARNLADDHIVKVFYFDEYRGSPYMVMEYIRGKSLDALLRERAGGMPFDEAWPLIRGMGRGLAYIHKQGMVHSDFKPGNVFVAEDGTAKILDLGIARASASSKRGDGTTRFDAGSLGALTPLYASPEMFERQAPDERDDVYALGCVVYELLTGEHVFGGEYSIQARALGRQIRRVEGLLTERRWRAIERALAFDRESRTPTVDRFLEELEGRRNTYVQRLLAVGAASALVAGALAVAIVPGADPDQAFLSALLDGAGAAEIGPTEQRQIENWLAQGTDYIEFARDSFESGDAIGGHRDLRGGADNAERAFMSVLRLTPSDAAAKGLLDIVNAYADGAEQFAASGNRGNALWLACQGYQLHPNHLRIGKLLGTLAEAGADASRVCRDARPN